MQTMAVHLLSLFPLLLCSALLTVFVWQIGAPQELWFLPICFAVCLLGVALSQWCVRREVQKLLGYLDSNRPADSRPGIFFDGWTGLGRLAREIEQLKIGIQLRNERIHHQSRIDPVTSLANRSVIQDRIEMAVHRATREQSSFAVLVIDVLQLSNINARFGHSIGDRVLRGIAGRLRNAVRVSDSVCRLGSDEFLLVVESAQEADLLRIARNIGRSLNHVRNLDGHAIRTRVACGAVLFPRHGSNWSLLIRRAEVAAQISKSCPERFALYCDGQDEAELRKVTLQDDWHGAIHGGQMRVVYQPKMRLMERCVDQVEALVRWQHPVLGSIAPDEFVPMAERSGQIHLLTHWVCEQALRQQLAWQQSQIDLTVAVNLSPLDLSDMQIYRVLKTLTRVIGVDPGKIILEVTESALLQDVDSSVTTLEALRELGFQIAIDDFGTGYSSLAQLTRLPVRELKIDKSFVRTMCDRQDDAVIVRSTIDMAHNLGLKVVAEGVENSTIEDALSDWGCDMVQGFHLGRPMSAEMFTGWYWEHQNPGQGALGVEQPALR